MNFPDSGSERLTHLHGLDVLRAVAILMVILSHGRYFLLDHFSWSHWLRCCGWVGVQFFFALSGFLIGRQILNCRTSKNLTQMLRPFYARRVLRILPVYYLFLWVWLFCIFDITIAVVAILFIRLVSVYLIILRWPVFSLDDFEFVVEGTKPPA